MQRHQRSFFGQKVGMIFDSGTWDEEYAYLTFLRKKQDGAWEKPTLKEGKYVKLNLGELILFRKVLEGTSDRWSTVHSFNGSKTTLSIQKHAQNAGEFWINVDSYGKSLRSPETDILEMLLKHVIKEKIVRATVRKKADN